MAAGFQDGRGRQPQSRRFAEFFAGIGLMRAGLERAGWRCVYANDNDPDKAAMYASHFGRAHFDPRDIRRVTADDVLANGMVELATASFPCTDLSLAGGRGGIRHGQSALFWTFADLIEQMGSRRPRLILLENVVGFLRSSEGADFLDAMQRLNELGYAVDPVVLDARWFVPQSRPRLFVVASYVGSAIDGCSEAVVMKPSALRPQALVDVMESGANVRWSIRDVAMPERVRKPLKSILDHHTQVRGLWWGEKRAAYLWEQFRLHHRRWLEERRDAHQYLYATAFRRMRPDDRGESRSTAELRTDGLAGCLRTPKGGSARQILVRIGKGKFNARHLTPRECARLMGADDFRINTTDTKALFGFGDAVCIPVVEWVARQCLEPALQQSKQPPVVRIAGNQYPLFVAQEA